jgi:hypothetical protein
VFVARAVLALVVDDVSAEELVGWVTVVDSFDVLVCELVDELLESAGAAVDKDVVEVAIVEGWTLLLALLSPPSSPASGHRKSTTVPKNICPMTVWRDARSPGHAACI